MNRSGASVIASSLIAGTFALSWGALVALAVSRLGTSLPLLFGNLLTAAVVTSVALSIARGRGWVPAGHAPTLSETAALSAPVLLALVVTAWVGPFGIGVLFLQGTPWTLLAGAVSTAAILRRERLGVTVVVLALYGVLCGIGLQPTPLAEGDAGAGVAVALAVGVSAWIAIIGAPLVLVVGRHGTR